jgi:hypothetical protein
MPGVYNIAIVGDSHSPGTGANHNRLNIPGMTGTSGGIAIVADGNISGKPAQRIFFKGLGYQTHPGMELNILAIGGSNTSALLAAVLKGK